MCAPASKDPDLVDVPVEEGVVSRFEEASDVEVGTCLTLDRGVIGGAFGVSDTVDVQTLAAGTRQGAVEGHGHVGPAAVGDSGFREERFWSLLVVDLEGQAIFLMALRAS